MLTNPDIITARELLLSLTKPSGTEMLSLEQSYGRVLARAQFAREAVPPFDRSPYDGYAFQSGDTHQGVVTLRVLEEIPAGGVPHVTVTSGTAVKVLTGAPIPPGADAVVKFEDTTFTPDTVTLSTPFKPGENIVRRGEDVCEGQPLANPGQVIDAGLAGTLASQGILRVEVYRRPRVGILSTGSELVEADQVPGPGMIRNTNRYSISAAVQALGCEPVWLGTAGDDIGAISRLFARGAYNCDCVISTGGVSVGDYDLTDRAMTHMGGELLFKGVDMKPGMACAYSVWQGKLLCGLSGNPASSLTNFYALVLPVLRKLAGLSQPVPPEMTLTLSNGFGKKSPKTRLLRGKVLFTEAGAVLEVPKDQGNVVLSSAIGCDGIAIVPAGSGKLEAGTVLKGFLV